MTPARSARRLAARFGIARRRGLVVLLAAASVLSSIGCRGFTSNAEDGVRVLVAGDPAELEAYRDVVAAYAERYPDAHVRLIETAERDQLIARLSTSIAAGTPPDLFLLNYRYFGQFAARGAIEPIDDELEGSGALAGDDFYPQAVEAFSYGGEQMCLPQNISSLVVYYNRDLRRAAGLGDPSPSWSWQQMVHDAERLTADPGDDGAEVYGLGVDPEVIRVAPFVWSNGGRLVDDEETPTRFLLTEVHAVQALQAFLDLRAVHGVVPAEEEAESQDLASRFLDGGLAMILESRRVTPTFRTITDFEWDVAPLPRFSRPATILHSDGYCLTAASDRKDEAWRFIEFALGPDGQRIAAMTGRTVPSAVAVAESGAFLDPAAPPAASRVFLDGIDHVRRVPNAAAWPEVEDAANAILEEAYYEGAEAAEVAREIERVTTPLFSRPLEP